MPFTFGCDPEFMLVDDKGNFKSAIDVVSASKKRPIQTNGYSYYYDNVLAELTMPPGSTKEETVQNIQTALRQYAKIVAPYRLTATAAADYPRSELAHKAAKRAGCKPEKCAYIIDDVRTDSVRAKFKKGTLRCAGGHVHLGTPLGKNHIPCLMLVRMLDLFLAIPSIWIDHDETNAKRKQLYGVAGRYRQPEHGVEYRSLSNFWLASPKLTEMVYDLCDFTIKFVEEGRHNKLWRIDEETLNSDDFWNRGGNPAKCHICEGYDVVSLRKSYDTTSKKAAMPFMEFAASYLPTDLLANLANLKKPKQYDLYKEWGLN